MKPRSKNKFWIKERHNPQLGVYYVAHGQMSKTAAKKHESSLYGDNYMHAFDTEEAYQAELARLKKEGQRIQT